MISCCTSSITGALSQIFYNGLPLLFGGIGLVSWFTNANLQKANEYKCETLHCIELSKENLKMLQQEIQRLAAIYYGEVIIGKGKKLNSPAPKPLIDASGSCNEEFNTDEGAIDQRRRCIIRGDEARKALAGMRKSVFMTNITLGSLRYPGIEEIEKNSEKNIETLLVDMNNVLNEIICPPKYQDSSQFAILKYYLEKFSNGEEVIDGPVGELKNIYKNMEIMSSYRSCLFTSLRLAIPFPSKKKKEASSKNQNQETNPPKS